MSFDVNKEIVFDLLSKTDVKKFEVAFDGYGDSGQLEEIVFEKKSDENYFEQIVKGVSCREGMVWENGRMRLRTNVRDLSLKDLVLDVSYEILEAKHGGWEINEGSYGNFTWDVEKRTIQMEYNERYVEVNTTIETV